MNWSTAYSGFKSLIIRTEGTEEKNDLDINWATAYVGEFKWLILWIECSEDKNNFDIN